MMNKKKRLAYEWNMTPPCTHGRKRGQRCDGCFVEARQREIHRREQMSKIENALRRNQ